MRLKVVYSSLLILLASCTSELPETPDFEQSQEQGVPVSFTYSVQSKQDIGSRAPIESEYLPENSLIGIYALKGTVNENEEFIYNNPTKQPWADDNLQPSFLNTCYQAQTLEDFDGSYINRLTAVGIPGSFTTEENSALEFYAYYPYTEEVDFELHKAYPTAPQIPIRIDNDIENTIDYLYTAPIVSKSSSKTTDLTFKHALAKLEIYITTDTINDVQNFTGRKCPKVTKIEVGTNKPQEGTLELGTGRIRPSEESTYYDFSKEIQTKNIVSDNNHTPRCSFLFFPGKAPLYYLDFHVTTTSNEKLTFQLNSYNTPALDDIELKQGYVTKLYITYRLDH